ncbi:MAG: hypothetical protein P8L30_16640 [Longimicrobiales bacterium]|nr:hypothetical protein [Longimicrobiales bacterium]
MERDIYRVIATDTEGIRWERYTLVIWPAVRQNRETFGSLFSGLHPSHAEAG